MIPIDKNLLKRLQGIVDKYSSDKSVVTARLTKFLKDRFFKIKIKDEIYYGFFLGTNILQEKKLQYRHYGIDFHLGWSLMKYDIYFVTEKGKLLKLTLHYNDLLDIEYEEISKEKYFEILKMFTQ